MVKDNLSPTPETPHSCTSEVDCSFPPLESVIDLKTIAYLRQIGGNEADNMIAEVIQIYLEDTPATVQQIKDALAAGERDKLKKLLMLCDRLVLVLAHSISENSAPT